MRGKNAVTGVLRPVRARLPEPLIAALDGLASRTGQTRSAVVRWLLIRGLSDEGDWPPRQRAESES